MTLIPNWKNAWRMFSVQALALIAFAQTVLAVMTPAMLESVVPFTALTYVDALSALTVLAAVLGGVGRLIDQPAVQE